MTRSTRVLSEKASFEKLRPLHVFLGISAPTMCLSPNAFSPPVQNMDKTLVEKLIVRLKFNIGYFITNYLVVAFGIAIVVSLLHPGMIVVCGMLWGLWWVHNYLIHHELLVFGRNIGMILPITQRSSALTILTCFAIFWKCLGPFVSFVSVSAIVILIHALLRDPKNVKNNINGEYDHDNYDEGVDDDDDVEYDNGALLDGQPSNQRDDEESGRAQKRGDVI